MSWLSRAWDHNRNFVGKAVESASPLLALTPLGPLGAAGGAGLGKAMQKGTNIGDIGWAAGRGGLYGAAANTWANGVGGPSADAGYVRTGGAQGLGMPKVPGGLLDAPTGSTGSSLASRVTGALGSIGNFAKNNAIPIGQAASGILNAREQGSQNAIQQQRFNFDQRQYDEEQDRKRRIAQLLGPLYQQMMASQGSLGAPPWRG